MGKWMVRILNQMQSDAYAGHSLLRRVIIFLVWKGIPDYTSDIVMLKLKTPLTLNDYVQKICLPPPEFKADREVVYSDQRKSPVCLITGWGKWSNAKLKQATVPVSHHPISCYRK